MARQSQVMLCPDHQLTGCPPWTLKLMNMKAGISSARCLCMSVCDAQAFSKPSMGFAIIHHRSKLLSAPQ